MKDYLNETIDAISKIVQFDSSCQKPTPTTPFGQENFDCLCYFLEMAEEMGFKTNNYEGYAGEVLYGDGNEDNEFAILAHLDVVPAGLGWKYPPFDGIIAEGKIWGRGTTDDKGPAICCLYALKMLKDQNIKPTKKIKLIVGMNEESGWACMKRYKELAHMPEYGFSPDADFPVIISEKGILHVRMHFPFPVKERPFLYVQSRLTANMVPDRCYSVPVDGVYDSARMEKYGLRTKLPKLVSVGKSAHGSTPELGKNAIEPMLRYYAEKNARCAELVHTIFEDPYGLTKIQRDGEFLTMSPNVIRTKSDGLHVTYDIRYPSTMTLKEVQELLAQYGVLYETLSHQAPLRAAPESDLVKTLLSVYEDCTGVKAKPIGIGGGTYARALKHGVAFGPEMPGDEPTIHQPNEYITLERVELLLKTYYEAIKRLCC